VPESKVIALDERAKDKEKPFLEQLLQEGARKLLQAAIENEVIDYIQFHKDRRDEHGHRAPSVEALIPALYLKGISTGDFSEALAAILGDGASGLSATNIVRLKVGWESDYKAWTQRDLSQKRSVYWWADGVESDDMVEQAGKIEATDWLTARIHATTPCAYPDFSDTKFGLISCC